MSAENPNEQKEWQGQMWKYLVMNVHPWSFIVEDVYYAPQYKSSIKEFNKDFGSMLELLGGDGWELVGMYVAESIGSGDLRLFFKRPGREK